MQRFSRFLPPRKYNSVARVETLPSCRSSISGGAMHDDQFTAVGPPNAGSGMPNTAFSNNGPGKFEIGANIVARRCGIYGAAFINTPAGTPLREPPAPTGDGTRMGVCGVGNEIGVFGSGSNVAGVYGSCSSNGKAPSGTHVSGLFGLAEVGGCVGVKGFEGAGTQRLGKVGAGVLGASEKLSGTGVVGLSLRRPRDSGRELMPLSNSNDPARANGDGTGVIGASGTGTGVLGVSKQGDGVAGVSDTGRGGSFESKAGRAQVRLVAQRDLHQGVRLPRRGKVGDLILLRNREINLRPSGPRLHDVCTLWLCIPRDSTDDSNQWQQVMLGRVVQGTA